MPPAVTVTCQFSWEGYHLSLTVGEKVWIQTLWDVCSVWQLPLFSNMENHKIQKKKNTYSIFNFQENRSLGGFTGSFLCLFLHFCSKISFSQTFKMFKVCTASLPSKIQKYHAIYVNTYIDIYFSFWLIQVPTVNARLSVEVGRMWHPHFSWFVPIEKHKGVVVECRVNNFTAGVSGEGRLVCLRSCNSAAVEKWHALWDLDARRNEWVICERGLPPPR